MGVLLENLRRVLLVAPVQMRHCYGRYEADRVSLGQSAIRPFRIFAVAQQFRFVEGTDVLVDSERRAEIAPLRKTMQAAESVVTKLGAQMAKLDADLADPALYNDATKTKRLTFERGQVAKKLSTAEAAWLAATDAFEQASALVDA